MKRIFDVVFAVLALSVLFFPCFMIAVLVKLTSKGPIIFWSDRVGKNNVIFKMPKFRSMHIDAPSVATHLLFEPKRFYTPIGGLLRKSSLDEFPQFWSIIKGDMSLVGPRPALFNQADLIALRTEKGTHGLLPGLIGWAQINGRDELSILQKVDLDDHYLQNQSMCLDVRIILLTLIQVWKKIGISH